jgi:hypothetical protein
MVPYEKLHKVTIYVARISRDGARMPSKPCNNCMIMLFGTGPAIKRLVYFDGKVLAECSTISD